MQAYVIKTFPYQDRIVEPGDVLEVSAVMHEHLIKTGHASAEPAPIKAPTYEAPASVEPEETKEVRPKRRRRKKAAEADD